MFSKLVTTFIFLAFVITVNAQSDSDIYNKLKNLDSEAEKVTINVDGEEVEFEGKEAQLLLRRLKMISKINLDVFWTNEDEEVTDLLKEENITIKIFDEEDDADVLFFSEDMINEEGVVKKKIEIDDKEGDKTVTVTTVENGEKSTETFTGEEAEEYLREFEKTHEMDCCKLKGHKKIFEIDEDEIKEGQKKINIILETSDEKLLKNRIIIQKEKKEEK